MDKDAFKGSYIAAGKSVEDIAKVLGKTPSAVYRKIKNNSFTLEEADKIADYLGMTNRAKIFLPEK